MTELVELAKAMTPTSWGVWSCVFMIAIYLIREWRETRKLSAEDRLARREGYAKQVELLMGENRALLEDIRKLREEYDRYRMACQRETEELRALIIPMKHEIAQLRDAA